MRSYPETCHCCDGSPQGACTVMLRAHRCEIGWLAPSWPLQRLLALLSAATALTTEKGSQTMIYACAYGASMVWMLGHVPTGAQ